MVQNEKAQKQKMQHNITIENRRRATITGILDIDSFNEQGIVALTDYGVLIIKGKDMHINKLSVDSGDVSIDGEIASFVYTDINDRKTGSIIKNLFK